MMRALKSRPALLLVFALALTSVSCAQTTPPPRSVGSPGGPGGSLVDVDWLSANLGKPGIVVLDVGAFTHYEKGHVPGAVKAFGPWQSMNDSFVGFMMPGEDDLVRMLRGYGVDNDSLVVVYDEGMTAQDTCRSARALWTLHALGHDKAAILDGGFAAWEHANKPVSTEPPFPAAGDFSGSLVTAKVAGLEEVRRMLGSPAVVFVDNRSPEEHFGHEKKSNVKRFGHLPGSRLWPASFVTKAGIDFSPSLMRGTADLEQMAAGVGIPSDRSVEIVTYSNTGLQAAMGYFVLHDLLGYRNVKVFDGSILESAADEEVPMERDAWGHLRG